MKKIYLWLCLSLLMFSCSSDDEPTGIENVDPGHFTLQAIYPHLPFQNFNDHSVAVFRDANTKEARFNITIEERVVDFFHESKKLSFNELTFRYSPQNIELPTFVAVANLRDLPDSGLTEMIHCHSENFFSSFFEHKLEIIPGTDYKTTILNETLNFMGETFENAYSNILVQENPPDLIRMYYQGQLGLVGFKDSSGKTWVFDRFE